GKRALRGQGALAEARAAGHEVEDMRLQLVESAASAFYDYYLVGRALAVNREGLRLLQDLRQKAQERYERVPAANRQDGLRADGGGGRQRGRRMTRGRMREVAVARLNPPLPLPPDAPLPPPPREVTLAVTLPDTQALRATALAHRPDLQALADRV